MLPDSPFGRVSRDALADDLRPMWDNARELHGDTTFVEVMGAAPEVLRWYRDGFYGELFNAGRVERGIKELVRLRLANVHGCAFCNRADRLAALAAGVPAAQVDAIANYRDGPFDAREQAALELADVMVLTNLKGAVSRDLHTRLRQHFDDAQLVELGMVMAVLVGMAKMIFAYDLVEKEDYCPLA